MTAAQMKKLRQKVAWATPLTKWKGRDSNLSRQAEARILTTPLG